MRQKAQCATAYYEAMGRKDLATIEKFLAPHVTLSTPLGKVNGKEAVLASIKAFTNLFDTLTVETALGNDDKAVIVYELTFPAPINTIRATSYMTFQEEFISEMELFYDPRPFAKNREQIFAQN